MYRISVLPLLVCMPSFQIKRKTCSQLRHALETLAPGFKPDKILLHLNLPQLVPSKRRPASMLPGYYSNLIQKFVRKIDEFELNKLVSENYEVVVVIQMIFALDFEKKLRV